MSIPNLTNGVPTLTYPRHPWRYLCVFSFVFFFYSSTFSATSYTSNSLSPQTESNCLPHQAGYLRARINGTINSELSWNSPALNCTGSVRPDSEGLRLQFNDSSNTTEPALSILFGISGLKAGDSGKALPTNITIMVEGKGEFYATQGYNKCTTDEIKQIPLSENPTLDRVYQVIARGFCIQPARELNGNGAILISRFDFSGRVDFSAEPITSTESSPP